MNEDENNLKYDPSAVGVKGSLFGLPYREEESKVIVVPVPWDVTVSYGEGTEFGPKAILDASPQLDLEIHGLRNPWEVGIHMTPISDEWIETSREWRPHVKPYLEWLESGKKSGNSRLEAVPEAVNGMSLKLNDWVEKQCLPHLALDKLVGVVGGEHSSPLGLIKAAAAHYNDFGILQIDAHADLRDSYEGFTYSHASIMFNALKIEQVKKLVQVGVRDYAPSEQALIAAQKGRVHTWFDAALNASAFQGTSWQKQCDEIIKDLPQHVHLSFDIDGLEPSLCPNTGTPVPGGLSFSQAIYLVQNVAKSDRKIVSFDLCEVAPGNDEWDANVGARVLYQIIAWAAHSRGWVDEK